MLNYFYRKTSLLVFISLGLTAFVFSLNYLFPGEVLTNMTGYPANAIDNYPALITQYRIDDSIIAQYFAYLDRLFNGNWGVSMNTGDSIYELVFTLLPATIELALYALLYSFIVAIPFGLLSASESRRWLDKGILSLSLIGFSMPIFWLALIMTMIFSINLGWLPTSGRLSLVYQVPADSGFILWDIIQSDLPYKWEAFSDALKHLILPTFVLAAYPTTVLIRTTRQSMKTVMAKSYIKAARAKGLSTWQVLRKHGLRNGLLPVIQTLGIHFGTLITLAMVTEVIFAWPGVGSMLVDAIHQRDYTTIQGGLLVISALVFLTTIVFDVIYMIFDPIARAHGYGKI